MGIPIAIVSNGPKSSGRCRPNLIGLSKSRILWSDSFSSLTTCGGAIETVVVNEYELVVPRPSQRLGYALAKGLGVFPLVVGGDNDRNFLRAVGSYSSVFRLESLAT